jgi:hypothetical protein
MRIDRIVITGDVFRTTCGDPNQLGNVRWLRGEVARLLYDLTGLWPDVRYRRNAPDGGPAVIAEWYRLLGYDPPSIDAWAATFAQTSPPADLIEAMRPDYERALVVGFELSPLMISVLDRIGVPWIDVELGPVRFLHDLALDLRFSWPVEPGHPGLVTRRHLDDAVARMRERYRDDMHAAQFDGACIFLAQTRHDRSLIKNGTFFADDEAIERIASALGGRPLVVKPHPLAPDNPLLEKLRDRFAAATTDANIYSLLATAAGAHFLTISSSAAIEARHFGHAPEMFHAGARPHSHRMIASLWAHRSPGFWRSVLGPVLRLRRLIDLDDAELLPDRLRRSLGSWGWLPQGGIAAAQGAGSALAGTP